MQHWLRVSLNATFGGWVAAYIDDQQDVRLHGASMCLDIVGAVLS